MAQSAAGFHASIATWIKSRDVAIVGSDAGEDVTPSQVEGVALPVHTLLITGMGINLLDNHDLEAVARSGLEAESLGVHDHDRTGAGNGRNGVPGQYHRHILTSSQQKTSIKQTTKA